MLQGLKRRIGSPCLAERLVALEKGGGSSAVESRSTSRSDGLRTGEIGGGWVGPLRGVSVAKGLLYTGRLLYGAFTRVGTQSMTACTLLFSMDRVQDLENPLGIQTWLGTEGCPSDQIHGAPSPRHFPPPTSSRALRCCASKAHSCSLICYNNPYLYLVRLVLSYCVPIERLAGYLGLTAHSAFPLGPILNNLKTLPGININSVNDDAFGQGKIAATRAKREI